MMTLIAILLVLIILLLLFSIFLAYVAWQKVSLYLTWNTRNESLDYEMAITKPKFRKPATPASKTEQRGRAIKQTDDLVDIADLDFDTAVKAIEQAGQ